MADQPTQDTPFADLEPAEQEQFIRDALTKDVQASGDARTDDQAFGDRLIATALDLRVALRDLNAKVNTSREMLRGMVTLDQLTDTQKTAVGLIYPVRERKPKPAAAAAENNGDGAGDTPPAKPKPAAARS